MDRGQGAVAASTSTTASAPAPAAPSAGRPGKSRWAPGRRRAQASGRAWLCVRYRGRSPIAAAQSAVRPSVSRVTPRQEAWILVARADVRRVSSPPAWGRMHRRGQIQSRALRLGELRRAFVKIDHPRTRSIVLAGSCSFCPWTMRSGPDHLALTSRAAHRLRSPAPSGGRCPRAGSGRRRSCGSQPLALRRYVHRIASSSARSQACPCRHPPPTQPMRRSSPRAGVG
jgi:hypothetical protein